MVLTKCTLREQVLQRRSEQSAAARRQAGDALAATLEPLLVAARRVAAYVSIGTEPPTNGILELCRQAGRAVLLPVLQPDGDLDWALADEPRRLAAGRLGLMEPTGPRLGPEAILECDVVLVPALAVDRRGHRLGRGGGSYDRALRRRQHRPGLGTPAPGRTVALLYDGELVEELAVQSHDVPVQGVALPAFGLVDLTGPAGPPTGRPTG